MFTFYFFFGLCVRIAHKCMCLWRLDIRFPEAIVVRGRGSTTVDLDKLKALEGQYKLLKFEQSLVFKQHSFEGNK